MRTFVKRSYLSALLLSGLVAVFQACGGPEPFASGSHASGSGNGTGYEGAPPQIPPLEYVYQGSCDVPTQAEALIQVNAAGSRAYLTVSECTPVAPVVRLDAASLEITTESLTYEGRAFTRRQP